MAQSIKTQPIAVIGAGAWGTALALLLARNGNPVRLWGNVLEHQTEMINDGENRRFLPGATFPDNLSVVTTLEEALDNVQDVLIVVPSNAFRFVLKDIAALSENKSMRLAWGTKGLDPSTQRVLSDVVTEIFSEDMPIAILSGP
ncbi:MAG: NAD(P)-binding domain-containing protein, partial [Coxiellaceae bacterium]|nr:NAD(P)-binding domain-containing protein [Coxiellaceae bacterium]